MPGLICVEASKAALFFWLLRTPSRCWLGLARRLRVFFVHFFKLNWIRRLSAVVF